MSYIPPECRLAMCAQDPVLNKWEFDLRLMVLDTDSSRAGAGRDAVRQMVAIERLMPMSDFIHILAERALSACPN